MAHIMGRGARPQPDLQGFLDDGCSLDNRNNLSFDLVRGLDSQRDVLIEVDSNRLNGETVAHLERLGYKQEEIRDNVNDVDHVISKLYRRLVGLNS